MAIASTIGGVLAAHATRDPDSPAIVHPVLGTISFGTLIAHLQRLDDQLRAAGIGPTSRVGIALQRGPEAALLSLAVCCRAILVPINPNLAPADLQA
ncbi:MAG: AMP-binding protein, partial [Alphaproteobacteria bacterium]|nr:AMP-binding protein [Alphaproteobacteria bacterium]